MKFTFGSPPCTEENPADKRERFSFLFTQIGEKRWKISSHFPPEFSCLSLVEEEKHKKILSIFDTHACIQQPADDGSSVKPIESLNWMMKNS
jgi:hypothetical protein